MKKMNCLIVDDEPVARDIVETYVRRLPQLHLLKSCRNATEAFEALYAFPVDLVFLDIQMPVISGTDFLRSLRDPPAVVFTTAYSNYAVEGFELNSVDYLLKPITFERFCQAIQRVETKLLLNQTDTAKQKPVYIFIKQDSKLIRIDFDDIMYVRAERDFSSVFLQRGKRLLTGMHLKVMEDALPDELFMRVHRSYIINLAKISSVDGNTIIAGDFNIPIGASYRELFLKRITLL